MAGVTSPLCGRSVTARHGPAECNMENHNEKDVPLKKRAHMVLAYVFKGANLLRLDFNIGYLDPKKPPLYNWEIFLFVVDSIGLCLFLLASFAFNRNIPSPKTCAEILVWQNLSVARTKKCVSTPTFHTGNSSTELRPLRARRWAPIFCDRCSPLSATLMMRHTDFHHFLPPEPAVHSLN